MLPSLLFPTSALGRKSERRIENKQDTLSMLSEISEPGSLASLYLVWDAASHEHADSMLLVQTDMV